MSNLNLSDKPSATSSETPPYPSGYGHKHSSNWPRCTATRDRRRSRTDVQWEVWPRVFSGRLGWVGINSESTLSKEIYLVSKRQAGSLSCLLLPSLKICINAQHSTAWDGVGRIQYKY